MCKPSAGVSRETAVLPESAACVWVSCIPSSLSDSGWFRCFRRASLLEYCAARLSELVDWPVILVGAFSRTAAVHDIAARCGLGVYGTSSGRQMQGMIEAALRLRLRRILIVHGLFGLDIVPAAFLRELVAEHVRSGAGATLAKDLPAPLCAAVCERSVLSILAQLPPGAPIPDEPPKVLEIVAGILSKDPSWRGRAPRTKSFLEHYGTDRTQVPSWIPWTTPADVSLLESVVEIPSSCSTLARLSVLRDLMVERLDRVHRNQARRHRVSSKITVLFASNPSAYSGSEQCLINTVRALRNGNVDLHCLVALEGVFTERLRAGGANVHCPQRDFANPTVPNFLELDRLLDRVKPDLIHCNAGVGTPLLALSRLRSIPLAQWVRVAETGGLIEHLLCADRITAVSRFIARELSNEMIRADKVRVVWDGIDTDHFSPDARPRQSVRSDLNIADEEFLVLCVARFVPSKRQEVLIKAIALARRRHPLLRLVLIGEQQPGFEEYYSYCISELRRTDLLSRTTLLTFQDDILGFEMAADAVVLCSEREALGTVVLESMALGRPVIVADSGGLPEMIEHELSGLHCAPGDPVSLCEQICRVIEDRSLRDFIGRNARQRAVNQFSLEAHARTLWSVYEDILGRR